VCLKRLKRRSCNFLFAVSYVPHYAPEPNAFVELAHYIYVVRQSALATLKHFRYKVDMFQNCYCYEG